MTKFGLDLFSDIKSGQQRKSDYREKLEAELDSINNQEMWVAGKELRPLRPENK